VIRYILVLFLVACAQSTPYPGDADGVTSDAGIAISDSAVPELITGADLCSAGFDRNEQLGCELAGPGVHACPVQWDGTEQCDQAHAAECMTRLMRAELPGSPTCSSLRVTWRADCLTACSPTTP
jgi:hypothetical protein